MSERLKSLINEQNSVWQRMQDIRATAEKEDRDLTAEERESWDQAEARLTEVSGDIERFERMARLEKIDRSKVVVATPTGDTEERDATEAEKRYGYAFEVYIRRGMGRLSEEQRELLEAGHVNVRAQSTQDDTLGGYTVPEGFRNVITEAMKAFGGILGLATVITTGTGQDLPWPTNDDTGNEGGTSARTRSSTSRAWRSGSASSRRTP